MMKQLYHILVALVCLGLFTACQNIVYSESEEFENGWPADQVLEFPFTIDDAAAHYQMDFVVRNTDDYQNQNLWLFAELQLPNGSVQTDTLQYFLADEFGRWTGSGVGSIYENKLTYKQRTKFNESGTYIVRLRHGMRYNVLSGIDDVGLKVVKLEQ